MFSFVYRSKDLEGPPYPTVLHFRGTGFNSPATYFAYITSSQLAVKSRCQIIEIEHRLAPEYPCPIGFEDAYECCQLIIKDHQKLEIDITKIALCGYSSGGTFAASTAIQLKKEFFLSFQILISPLTDLSRSLRKFKAVEDCDCFPDTLAQWFIDLYLQNKHDPRSHKISPYWSEDLVNLPPTYILTAEYDRFRSDSECYLEKLIEHNIWTHKTLFKNENHMMYWKNIRVIETIAKQLQTAFCLAPIPKSLSPIPYKCRSIMEKNVVYKANVTKESSKEDE